MRRPTDAAIAAATLTGVVAFILVDWLLDGSRPKPGGYLGGDFRAYFVPAQAYFRSSEAPWRRVSSRSGTPTR
jgi:hypothetical protein